MDIIEGYVEKIVYRNTDNGYTVLSVSFDGEDMTCVGTFQYINEGETIKATGRYTAHMSYGEQFKIDSYETIVIHFVASDYGRRHCGFL